MKRNHSKLLYLLATILFTSPIKVAYGSELAQLRGGNEYPLKNAQDEARPSRHQLPHSPVTTRQLKGSKSSSSSRSKGDDDSYSNSRRYNGYRGYKGTSSLSKGSKGNSHSRHINNTRYNKSSSSSSTRSMNKCYEYNQAGWKVYRHCSGSSSRKRNTHSSSSSRRRSNKRKWPYFQPSNRYYGQQPHWYNKRGKKRWMNRKGNKNTSIPTEDPQKLTRPSQQQGPVDVRRPQPQ